MLDRFAYVAMTGAKHSMGQLANTTNNLANAQTPGFREMVASFRSVSLNGERADSRAFVVDSTPGSVFAPGPIQTTGNPLDVAIKNNEGFFAVRRPDGSEAYTRAGKFTLDELGVFKAGPNVVVGEAGTDITVPTDVSRIEIANDGIIYGFNEASSTFDQIDRLRLVNIDPKNLVRGADGLFEAFGVEAPELDRDIRVQQGALELSNVNPTNAMVQMIEQNRMFDLNIRFIQTADQNAKAANTLMTMSRG
jgi:flagellar basal-body rod protein FlgF